jgi:hypothetical protein
VTRPPPTSLPGAKSASTLTLDFHLQNCERQAVTQSMHFLHHAGFCMGAHSMAAAPAKQ